MTRLPRLLPIAAVVTAVLAAGCAGPRIDGQWSDPAFADRNLAGQPLLVSCRAPDTVLARLCEDRFAEALRELGARPVAAPAGGIDAAGGNEAVARAARAAGATAVVSASVSVASVPQPGYGPTVGFGLGGGIGGGGVSFGGIGISVPLGGVRPQSSFGASTALVDAATGREMWAVRATSPIAEDASVQVAGLARTSVEAMRKAGLFGAR
jgi:hypothetical protein